MQLQVLDLCDKNILIKLRNFAMFKLLIIPLIYLTIYYIEGYIIK
jgi:hypothetical protein